MRRRLPIAGLIALLLLALFPHGTPAVAAPRVSGEIVARQIDHSMPAYTVGELRRQSGAGHDPATGATGGETLSLTSPILEAGQLFDRVGVHWRAAWGREDTLLVELRSSADGLAWDDWQLVHHDEDLADPMTNTWYAMPIPASPGARYAQYRVWLTDGDPGALEHIAVTVLDVNDLNKPALTRLIGDLRGALTDMARAFSGAGYASAAPAGASKILTRQDWAADESLMRWTPAYVPIQKAVIHHTVTSDGGTNVAAEIRSVYYFHAVTRGWGDIGYSYLADKFGNIWTGRQGGDHTVGGHALGWNNGTFAVAAIGDYSVRAPTGALQGAIGNVIAMKFRQLGVAPFGSGAYTHREQRPDGSWDEVTSVTPNVLGHRDCTHEMGKSGAATACPGGAIYNMMDGLRRLAQTAWQEGYNVLTRIDPQLPSTGFPAQVIDVPVVVSNAGAQPIPAGTALGYQVLRAGQLVTQGAAVQLAQPVAPGGSATLSVPFVAPPKGDYVVRWGLQTGSAWWNTVYNDPWREQWFRSADWSARFLRAEVGSTWSAGEVRMVGVTVRNDGGRTWNAAEPNPVRIGYYWISALSGQRTEGQVKMPLPNDVPPGGQVSLNVPVTAPSYPTNYTHVFDMHKENEFWFQDKGLRPDDTPVNVLTDYQAQYELAAAPAFEVGKTVSVPVTVTNAGRGTFPAAGANPITLGYHWHDAQGQTVVWDGTRVQLPADLLAGQKVTLQAQVTAPESGGNHTLRFDLVQEGVGWFSSKGVPTGNLSVAVAGPVVPVYGASYLPGVSTLAQSGGLTAIPFTLTNSSNFEWSPTGPTPVTLSYHWADAGGRTIAWEGLRTQLPSAVPPGGQIQLQARVGFPTAQGTYTLRWDMVHEGVTWFSGKGVRTYDQTVVVGPPPSYGGSMDVSTVPTKLAAGATTAVPLRVQNLSNFQWDTTVNLGYHWYDPSGRVVVWDGLRTPLAGIRVGEVRSLDATVLAPVQSGTYVLRFDIVHEGLAWFSGQGMQLAPITVAVEPAGYGAAYSSPDTTGGAAGEVISVPIALRNTGGAAWQPGVHSLAYHLIAQSGNVYVWDGMRTLLPNAVAPGAIVVLEASVRLPATAGTWTIRFDMVHEGVTWFSGAGVPTGDVTLTVR